MPTNFEILMQALGEIAVKFAIIVIVSFAAVAVFMPSNKDDDYYDE